MQNQLHLQALIWETSILPIKCGGERICSVIYADGCAVVPFPDAIKCSSVGRQERGALKKRDGWERLRPKGTWE